MVFSFPCIIFLSASKWITTRSVKRKADGRRDKYAYLPYSGLGALGVRRFLLKKQIGATSGVLIPGPFTRNVNPTIAGPLYYTCDSEKVWLNSGTNCREHDGNSKSNVDAKFVLDTAVQLRPGKKFSSGTPPNRSSSCDCRCLLNLLIHCFLIQSPHLCFLKVEVQHLVYFSSG